MASTRRSTTRTTTTRETRATSRIGDDAAEGDVEPAKPGLGLAEAAVFVTTALLLLAIVLTDYQLGKYYASGLFFK